MVPITVLMTFTLLAAPGAAGDVTYAEYYVSKANGSDATGTGSIDSPWATITYAVDSIAAGPANPATVQVDIGSYLEVISLPPFVDVVGISEKTNCWPGTGDSCTDIYGLELSADNVIRDLVLFGGFVSPGAICSGTATPRFEGCHFYGSAPEGHTKGAGLQALDSSSPTCVNSIFTSNSVRLFVAAGKGGAIWQNSNGQTTLNGCTLYSNSAEIGGAIYAERGSIVCRDCVFTHNSASWGASIHATGDSSVTLINCRFTDNTLFEFNVSRIYDLYLSGAGSFTTINCTLAGTQGSNHVAYVPGVIRNCIFRGPIVRVWGDQISYSNIEGYSGGVGNIDVEPEFVNAAEEDYRLLVSSPCIDMGTDLGAPDHDLDGAPRPVDIPGRGFDGPGQGYDMGCYEYVPPSPTPTPTVTPTPGPVDGDLTGDGRADAEDVFFFAQWWEHARNETNYVADTNEDGHIDEIDLLWLTGAWR